MKRIDITIKEDQIKKLKALARKTEQTVSAIIRQAIDLYFKQGGAS